MGDIAFQALKTNRYLYIKNAKILMEFPIAMEQCWVSGKWQLKKCVSVRRQNYEWEKAKHFPRD